MEKDAGAYRTISEVADTLDLPPHVLRFWETKFTQIKPLKRGGGRRYYRREDIDLLRCIRKLLYEDGYTIRGVQRMLKEQGPRTVAALALKPAIADEAEWPANAEPVMPVLEVERVGPLAGAGESTLFDDGGEHGTFAKLEAMLSELDACRMILSAAKQFELRRA
jgi:DNA-binding transcriptional MerR regulator